MVGRRTCDQEVASSSPGLARLRNDSGQVVHTNESLSLLLLLLNEEIKVA